MLCQSKNLMRCNKIEKIPVVLGALGLSFGLLGTSVVGAASNSSKGFAKEKSVAGTEQTKSNGVQLRWWPHVVMDPMGKPVYSSSSSNSMCYASAGGIVGGHAPEMKIEEFGR
ncbi:hypothetical protein COF05_00075 [Bacillus pseudomycoides]|uniref:hypothetical protein n=1 Tax=Bacillus pseudomycoides TaxID=64104 RepID=UPI000BFD4777|nr:hypothetical protein [Bacillus pseudomycoides]PHC60473.1 hypothetical protein COF05_00075 [Bacillus pseudomycoides]